MKVVTGANLRQLNDKAWERNYGVAMGPSAFLNDESRRETGRINPTGLHIVICRRFRHGVGNDASAYHRCTVVAAMIESTDAPLLTVDIAEADYEALSHLNVLSEREFANIVRANSPQDPETLKRAVREALAEFVLV
jgi:hypothetical protein